MIENGARVYNGNDVYNFGGGGGGGGGTNPDGSKQVMAIYNTNTTCYIEIPVQISNDETIKIKYRDIHTGNYGIFAIIKDGLQYTCMALNSTMYLDAYSGGISTGNNPTVESGTNLLGTIREFENISFSSKKINAQNGLSGSWSLDYQSAQLCDKLRLFKGRSNYSSGLIEIFYFSVPGKIDLTPAIKNGVAGFFDSVSENFYPETTNTGGLFAIPWDN